MNLGFWGKLKKPFFVLAPMANVTDWAFRQIITETGRPDIFYTEFLSCDGIVHDRKRFAGELYFEENERPIVVQFFGAKPENFYKCAQLAQELGFDGIDINMGCPDRSVEKQGAGAALIKNSQLAKEIIKETIRGAGDLPVSIKTRLGYNKIEIDTWINNILETEIAALVVHGRTRSEMSKVPAHWDELGKIVKMAKGSGKLLIGNGDVANLEDGYKKAQEYGLDGIMIGRGIFSDVWFFNSDTNADDITPQLRIVLMLKHLELFEQLWKGAKHFDTMKKFFKIYVNGWDGAKELRTKLMNCKNTEEVINVTGNFLN